MCNYIWSCWKQSYRQGLYSWGKWLPLCFALLWSAAFWKLFYHIHPAFCYNSSEKLFQGALQVLALSHERVGWLLQGLVSPAAQSIRVPQLITLAGSDKLRARARAREPKFRQAQVLQIRGFVRKWSKNWCCKILLRITTVTYWNLQNLSWQCWFPAL